MSVPAASTLLDIGVFDAASRVTTWSGVAAITTACICYFAFRSYRERQSTLKAAVERDDEALALLLSDVQVDLGNLTREQKFVLAKKKLDRATHFALIGAFTAVVLATILGGVVAHIVGAPPSPSTSTGLVPECTIVGPADTSAVRDAPCGPGPWTGVRGWTLRLSYGDKTLPASLGSLQAKTRNAERGVALLSDGDECPSDYGGAFDTDTSTSTMELEASCFGDEASRHFDFPIVLCASQGPAPTDVASTVRLSIRRETAEGEKNDALRCVATRS